MLSPVQPWQTPSRVRPLSTWLACSGDAPAPPAPDRAAAMELLDLARHWHVSPALWLRVRHRQKGYQWPEDITNALRADYFRNAARNQRLRSTLLRCAAEFARAGLEPLLLKGAIHLVASPAPSAAERIMGDLDLLFRPEQTGPAFEILHRLGWIVDPECEPGGPGFHHLPRLIHPDEDTPIEIHRYPLCRTSAEWTRRFFDESVRAPDPSIPLRLPSPIHRLLNNALHAFDASGFVHLCAWESTSPEAAFTQLDLRQLLDFVEHARAAGPHLDWDRLLGDACLLNRGADVLQWGWLAHHLFQLDVPASVRGWPWYRPEVRRASNIVHYTLRTLARRLGWQGHLGSKQRPSESLST